MKKNTNLLESSIFLYFYLFGHARLENNSCLVTSWKRWPIMVSRGLNFFANTAVQLQHTSLPKPDFFKNLLTAEQLME